MKPLNPRDKQEDKELAERLQTLNEPSLLTRDAPPSRELSVDEDNKLALVDEANRMAVIHNKNPNDMPIEDIDIGLRRMSNLFQNPISEPERVAIRNKAIRTAPVEKNDSVGDEFKKSMLREGVTNVGKKLREEKEKLATGGLAGGQKELDKNNDGDITGEDFKMLREGKQEGGMLMDDQMADMMQTEETPDMENQMSNMMSPVAETAEEELQEQQAIEESQAPDEMMEDNYIDFLIDEALDEDEEEMLMEELQANPQLSMLFDKVMEVAMEFSGSGPVEGPGSEVSDSIPARLSDGEFVFTAKAVDVIGADNLMSMMKQAEAQAEERQPAQEGGLMEEENVMPVEQQPVQQNIRVTKETVGPQAGMQEEEDLVGDELKKSMLSTRPYVRS